MGDPASLRPLRAVSDVVASLREGILDGTGTRRGVLQVADAVERALRLHLRDDPAASTDTRLRALSPEELRTEALLAELRQHGRISMKLAASIHELFEARRRLEQGSSLGEDDWALAVRVAERLEVEVLQGPAAGPGAHRAASRTTPPKAPGAAPPAEPLPEIPPEPGQDIAVLAARPPRLPWIAGGAALVLALLAALLLVPGDRRVAEMDRGIALFRSGAFADAAAHFWRYAEANPDDPTPHLYLARIHRRMGRPQLAADELEKAIRLAPDDADVHAELGFLLLDTGRSEVAVERFRAALRLDAEAAGSWIGLVRALRENGRDEAAEQVIAQAPPEVRELFSRSTAAASP